MNNRPSPRRFHAVDGDAVANRHAVQQLFKQRIEAALGIVVRRDTWQAIRTHFRDALKAAQLAPTGGNIIDIASPKLAIESFKRQLCQRWADAGLKVSAQVRFVASPPFERAIPGKVGLATGNPRRLCRSAGKGIAS